MALAPQPAAQWLAVPAGHPFGLQTLPYGSFSDAHHAARRRVGVAVGDRVLDLTAAAERLLPGRAADFSSGHLDRFLAAGDAAWAQVRAALTEWLSHDHYRGAIEDLLVPADSVSLHLPFTVADYVDFYASEQHATNVGRLFRPDGEPLTPNWRHLPIGYHGRAGTVVVSGTPIRRPSGQTRPAGAPAPVYGACRRLDFEAELGFVVGVESGLGEPVPARRFAEHVFGACLVNDWSARDIQGWESQPLGPFLGKSFGTTISPWIVPLAALERARVRPPSLDTERAAARPVRVADRARLGRPETGGVSRRQQPRLARGRGRGRAHRLGRRSRRQPDRIRRCARPDHPCLATGGMKRYAPGRSF